MRRKGPEAYSEWRASCRLTAPDWTATLAIFEDQFMFCCLRGLTVEDVL